jgi:hypothetical protein
MKKARCAFQWVHHFFGLTPDDKVIYLEYVFTLMYYMGFSYSEVMNLPIWQRQWFVERMTDEFKKTEKSKGAHENTEEIRSLQGNSRSNVPSRLRRFT